MYNEGGIVKLTIFIYLFFIFMDIFTKIYGSIKTKIGSSAKVFTIIT